MVRAHWVTPRAVATPTSSQPSSGLASSKALMPPVTPSLTETLTPPCGTCRQIIWEFARSAKIVFANLEGKSEEFHIADLLPRAFDARFLTKKQ